MNLIAQYHAAITAMLQKIVDTQQEAIRTAARRCADASPKTGTVRDRDRATRTSPVRRCSGERAAWCRSTHSRPGLSLSQGPAFEPDRADSRVRDSDPQVPRRCERDV